MSEIPANPMGARRRFLWIALLTLFIYSVLAIFYQVPAWSGPRLHKELLLWPVTLGLLYLYWDGYRQMRGAGISVRWVVGGAFLLGLAAWCIPPFHSTDVFGYINRGWQQVHYEMNPYVYTVDHIRGWETDPMITDHWVNNPSPYGFVYLLIAKVLTEWGGGSKELTLAVFKLFNLVLHAATAWLIWLGVRRLQNGDARNALYLYAWNPLVLIHTMANGHNDIVMGFFVTLSALMALMGQWMWILPALAAATLIKYGALVILPPALLLLVKQRQWGALVVGVMLSGVVFLFSGLPYLTDWHAFRLNEIGRNAFVSHGSLHSLVYSTFKTVAKEVVPAWHEHKEVIRTILKNILLGAYMLLYAKLGIMRLRQKEYAVSQWIFDALLVMGVMVCLVSLKFYPWYLGMFFPLVFFLPEGHWLRRFVVVLSGGQLFALTFIGQAHLLNFIVMTALPLLWLFLELKKQKAVSGVETAITCSKPSGMDAVS